MEFIEFRFSQSYWTSLDDTSDDAANGVAIRFNLGNKVFHLLRLGLVGAAYRIIFDGVEIILMVIFL